jgi:glycosyltransferase involved in cell wall biosynthesis
MIQNVTETENVTEPESIRPLIISDRETVNQFCPSFRHMLFGFEAQDVPCAMVVPPKSDIEFLLFPGAKIIEYPVLRFPLFYIHNRKNLFERIESIRPGIVHCFGTKKTHLAKSIAEYLDIPAVVTLNSINISIRHRMLIDKFFEKIIAPSDKISLGLEKHFSKEKIKRVNVGTFADEACSCFASAHRLPSMIFPCKFDKFDDFEPMLNAIRHLAVDGNDFVVIFMGSGRAEKQIRDFINQTGLSQTVAISPLVRPLRSVFRGCDILIHSNCSGAFDPVVIEAAGAGLAVAADKNNVEEFLEEGSTGVFFDSTDELSIYAALQKLLNDRQMTRNLAINLQNNLRNNNSVSSMVNQLLKIYSETKKYSLSLPLL